MANTIDIQHGTYKHERKKSYVKLLTKIEDDLNSSVSTNPHLQQSH